MNGPLAKLTMIAKKVIYHPQRMESFLKMLRTKEGAVQAAMAVVAAVDKLSPVPPQVVPQLAVTAYMLIVDVAQEVTGAKPDSKIMSAVLHMVLEAATQASGSNVVERAQAAGAPMQQQQAAPRPAPQQGNVVSRMAGGVA